MRVFRLSCRPVVPLHSRYRPPPVVPLGKVNVDTVTVHEVGSTSTPPDRVLFASKSILIRQVFRSEYFLLSLFGLCTRVIDIIHAAKATNTPFRIGLSRSTTLHESASPLLHFQYAKLVAIPPKTDHKSAKYSLFVCFPIRKVRRHNCHALRYYRTVCLPPATPPTTQLSINEAPGIACFCHAYGLPRPSFRELRLILPGSPIASSGPVGLWYPSSSSQWP